MKPKSVHLIYKKEEEEWNNKQLKWLPTDSSTDIVGANNQL